MKQLTDEEFIPQMIDEHGLEMSNNLYNFAQEIIDTVRNSCALHLDKIDQTGRYLNTKRHFVESILTAPIIVEDV
jgi:hypothetical protein